MNPNIDAGLVTALRLLFAGRDEVTIADNIVAAIGHSTTTFWRMANALPVLISDAIDEVDIRGEIADQELVYTGTPEQIHAAIKAGSFGDTGELAHLTRCDIVDALTEQGLIVQEKPDAANTSEVT